MQIKLVKREHNYALNLFSGVTIPENLSQN
jgi:hypothetical protein